ncbi:hypothetical protein BWI17_01795 [Betaproteobacteria bacterium GR16-43]|nr:hypothetical protein BWI17_01795 [Betaproteobacteria bacterium GR16-43]
MSPRAFAALFVALLIPVSALAAANGQAVTPVNIAVQGSEVKTFSARFTNAAGAPVVGETVSWSNDVCGTFPNASSQATSKTDANGVATIFFTAAPNAGITCWLMANAGNASVQFNVVTFKLNQVALVADTAVDFDANGSVTIAASLRMGVYKLNEIDITARLMPGSAPAPEYFAPGASNTGQSGAANFLLRPPVGARGNYVVELGFRGLTKTVTISRDPVVAPVTSIIGVSPAGGTQSLNLNGATTTCGFAKSSAFLDPRATEFTADSQPARGLSYTEGVISIRAENCGLEKSVTFTLTTPRALPAGALFWMLSATPDNPKRRWHPIPVTVSGTSASFTLTDGVSDGDLAADGVVTAFGGFAVAPPWFFELQDLWWGGAGESGWGVSIVQHDEKLFAVIYAYDGNGMPTWYVMSNGTWNASRTTFTGPLYSPRGAPYTQYDAAQLDVGPPVGTLSITFIDSSHATLDYVINGMSARKPITRQIFGTLATNSRPPVGDMWWGGSQQNGWGIAILQQFGTLFAVWFTYNDVGEPVWFVMPAGSWSSADTFEGRIYRTASSRWLAMAYNTSAFRVFDVGSFRVRFTGAETAAFEWTIEGRSGALALQRQKF